MKYIKKTLKHLVFTIIGLIMFLVVFPLTMKAMLGERYSSFVREIFRDMGAIGIRDIREAEFLEGQLKYVLGFNEFKVIPGAKDTVVEIYKKLNDKEKKRMMEKIEVFRAGTGYKIKPLTIIYTFDNERLSGVKGEEK